MDFYKQCKENLEIRNKISVISKEKLLHESKKQLHNINSSQKEIIAFVESIKGNVKFVNEETLKLRVVINYENKIPMKKDDAEIVKDLFKTIVITRKDMICKAKLGPENINRINTNILKNASSNADYYKQSLQSNKELINNMKDLIDNDITDDDGEVSFRKSLINTQLFTDSLWIASTPMSIQSK